MSTWLANLASELLDQDLVSAALFLEQETANTKHWLGLSYQYAPETKGDNKR